MDGLPSALALANHTADVKLLQQQPRSAAPAVGASPPASPQPTWPHATPTHHASITAPANAKPCTIQPQSGRSPHGSTVPGHPADSSTTAAVPTPAGAATAAAGGPSPVGAGGKPPQQPPPSLLEWRSFAALGLPGREGELDCRAGLAQLEDALTSEVVAVQEELVAILQHSLDMPPAPAPSAPPPLLSASPASPPPSASPLSAILMALQPPLPPKQPPPLHHKPPSRQQQPERQGHSGGESPAAAGHVRAPPLALSRHQPESMWPAQAPPRKRQCALPSLDLPHSKRPPAGKAAAEPQPQPQRAPKQQQPTAASAATEAAAAARSAASALAAFLAAAKSAAAPPAAATGDAAAVLTSAAAAGRHRPLGLSAQSQYSPLPLGSMGLGLQGLQGLQGLLHDPSSRGPDKPPQSADHGLSDQGLQRLLSLLRDSGNQGKNTQASQAFGGAPSGPGQAALGLGLGLGLDLDLLEGLHGGARPSKALPAGPHAAAGADHARSGGSAASAAASRGRSAQAPTAAQHCGPDPAALVGASGKVLLMPEGLVMLRQAPAAELPPSLPAAC
ncbi:hypothetical protein HYH03_014044 [Edaphochlamys debaryana]|uniref:Uncharacterized protein n=1 Tax=Edaphochlamys debaryana TaxID=47281 RepID=A0A835XQX2_9CHLO|nr:hypothetical protein HYH03_014044 [Edaphochlamys debaryana]|eukprot:KAG2487328.1 hypothetical protein HYH03_014044 [Edaphochlamys debaryana]